MFELCPDCAAVWDATRSGVDRCSMRCNECSRCRVLTWYVVGVEVELSDTERLWHDGHGGACLVHLGPPRSVTPCAEIASVVNAVSCNARRLLSSCCQQRCTTSDQARRAFTTRDIGVRFDSLSVSLPRVSVDISGGHLTGFTCTVWTAGERYIGPVNSQQVPSASCSSPTELAKCCGLPVHIYAGRGLTSEPSVVHQNCARAHACHSLWTMLQPRYRQSRLQKACMRTLSLFDHQFSLLIDSRC